MLRTNWKSITAEDYEISKVILALFLFGAIFTMIIKNRRMDISNYIPYWQEIKKEEEEKKEHCEMNENSAEIPKCKDEDLRKMVCKNDYMSSFKDISKYIDEEIGNEDDVKEELQALICFFESDLNKTNTYTVITIAYAILIGTIAVLSNILSITKDVTVNYILFFIMIIAVIYVAIKVIIMQNSDYIKTFVLKVLNFKLEEFNNKTPNSNKSDQSKSEKVL